MAKKIRIVGADEDRWYEDKIGEEYGVLKTVGDYYYVDEYATIYSGHCEVVTDEQSPNMVESPPHYQNARFETIEVIEEITAGYSDGFVAYSVGNALKYLARAPFKHDDGGLEDLRKAAKYLEFAIKRIESAK